MTKAHAEWISIASYSVDLVPVLCGAITAGDTVILHSVTEHTLLTLSNVIERRIDMVQGSPVMTLAGTTVSYNSDFRLFLFTEQPYVRVLNEHAANICVICMRTPRDILIRQIQQTIFHATRVEIAEKFDQYEDELMLRCVCCNPCNRQV